MDSRELIAAWLEPAVRCWFRDQSRNPWEHFHLWYKPGEQSAHGAVIIAPDKPNDSWLLATGERVSPAKTEREVFEWAMEICWRLPLLKTA